MKNKIYKIIHDNEDYQDQFQNNVFFHNAIMTLLDRYDEERVVGLIQTLTAIIFNMQDRMRKMEDKYGE